ncbi:SLATT domain-containing protein [Sorangium sp. So ce1182]|uniref:SLATT domain-containing protein n=1 Tax=Sorangium sp. So ce1182 TaxID=3133334 RepID=UPI003F63F289
MTKPRRTPTKAEDSSASALAVVKSSRQELATSPRTSAEKSAPAAVAPAAGEEGKVLGTIEDQIRQTYLSVVYTHKAHEKEADMCTRKLRNLKVAQVATSALTATGTVAVILGDNYAAKVLTVLISLTAAIVSALARGMDPGGLAQEHRAAAASMWAIRQSYQSLLVDLRTRAISDAEARKRRDELLEKQAAIHKRVPRTSPEAYAVAQDALKNKEEYTSSDAEIDTFLPTSLKKAAHGNGSPNR